MLLWNEECYEGVVYEKTPYIQFWSDSPEKVRTRTDNVREALREASNSATEGYDVLRRLADLGTLQEGYAVIVANELWHVLNWARDTDIQGVVAGGPSMEWSEQIALEILTNRY